MGDNDEIFNLLFDAGEKATVDNNTEKNDAVVPKKIMENVVHVAAGNWHSLAVMSDGSLWAWGNNSNGQLGREMDMNMSSEPLKIIEDVDYAVAGGEYSLALKTDSSLWAWGANWFGQLGDGATTDYAPLQEWGMGSLYTGWNHI